MVILKAVNPKTKEMVVLPPFKLPPSYKDIATQPTAVEARHFAATYALFRVCSMRNIHMMLPPTYRDLWKKELQELKAEDVKEGRGWMYEADPFAAKQEREEAQALMTKKREERQKQKAKEAEQPANLNLNSSCNNGGTARNIMRGWTRVPKIELGKRTRAHIEDLVRRKTVWNPHGIQISEFQRRNIVNEITELGFRKSHIEEAVVECKDREETLEWLLIHVPEDDLPRWALPEGYVAGISMASGNLKREASIKRLVAVGYSMNLCGRLFDAHKGDEALAAEALQNNLIGGVEGVSEAIGVDMSTLTVDGEDGISIWAEEQDTLSAIFSDRFKAVSSGVCNIQLQVPKFKTLFTFAVRRSKLYPRTAPIVSIKSAGLPAYIRLSIIRQLVERTNKDLLGEPMVFNMVDWLETEVPGIIENPGKLRDVSAGATDLQETRTMSHKLYTQHRKRALHQIDWRPGNPQSLALLNRWQSRQESPRQQKMLAGRQSLPAWNLRDAIVKAVDDHQVTIISGETGSGKSTQSVQFVLDDMIQRKIGAAANIICTQPRRISALGLADRVSDERCSIVGDEVGYAIRGESKQKQGITKITFVTTGILLRRLQTSGGSSDDVVAALSDISHVVVDEVHERSLDTDFLLVLLRDVLPKRRDLKVILMSATLDAGVFERYFSQVSLVGKIEIQGRTYPVEDYHLDDIVRFTGFSTGSHTGSVDNEDMDDVDPSVASIIQGIGMKINYTLIASTVRAIDSQLGSQEGGILIFLPGTLEINRTIDALRDLPNLHALPLHASLMPIEQRRVFPPAPKGKRKVIAATNVAETSITIQDIVAVIDSGKVKETSFDPQNNMVKLEEVWASRAACKQRRGRAGRVQAGTCYKLYTRNAEAKMAERPEPEIRRVPLEQLCLSVRAMGITDVPSFLASALTPPENLAVEGAIDLLGRMGALDGSELTALGRHLSMIPADLRCSKLMVYGALFGCLEATLTIAAILTTRSPFVSPQSKRDESKAARSTFAPGQGDLLCDLRAYEQYSSLTSNSGFRTTRIWCDAHFLSSQTLADISSNRAQYLSSLTDCGFLPPNYNPSTHSALNAHNANTSLLRSLVAGAFNPQIARIDFPDKKYAPSVSGAIELDPEARTIKFFTQDSGRVFIHPASTLFDSQTFPSASTYLSYFTKISTSKIFVRDLTPLNVMALLLFSGPLELDTSGRGILVDGWVRVRGWARIGVLVGRVRGILDGVLAGRVEKPEEGWEDGEEVVGLCRRLVERGGLDA